MRTLRLARGYVVHSWASRRSLVGVALLAGLLGSCKRESPPTFHPFEPPPREPPEFRIIDGHEVGPREIEPDAGGNPCEPWPCSGCCSRGICLVGDDRGACGKGGVACENCGGLRCVNKVCGGDTDGGGDAPDVPVDFVDSPVTDLPPDAPCSPCPGCCGLDRCCLAGTCVFGGANVSCGSRGEHCVNCGLTARFCAGPDGGDGPPFACWP